MLPCRSMTKALADLFFGTKAAEWALPASQPVQWKVQGGSPEGTLAWVRQKGCFGADDKVVLASAGREAYAGGRFRWSRSAPLRFSTECRGREHKQPNRTQPTPALSYKTGEPEGAKEAGANCARELVAGRGRTPPRHDDCDETRRRLRVSVGRKSTAARKLQVCVDVCNKYDPGSKAGSSATALQRCAAKRGWMPSAICR